MLTLFILISKKASNTKHLVNWRLHQAYSGLESQWFMEHRLCWIRCYAFFLLCPNINTVLAYGCTYLTILPRLNGAGMTIFVLNDFLNGSWKIAAFIIVLFIIDILIYYPFFQLLDRKSYEQEKATTSSTKI